MTLFLLWLPWILRGISGLSAIIGLFQGTTIATSDGYSATPFNLSLIGGSILTSIGSFIASFLAGPTGWTQIKKALDKVFAWVHDRLKIDPENRTDLDERVMAYIAEQILTLLEKIVSQWKTSEEAKKSISALRFAMLVDKSGAPPAAAVTAITSTVATTETPAKKV